MTTTLVTIPAPVANPGRTRFVVATSIELEAADTQSARQIIGALATYLAVGVIRIGDVKRVEAAPRRASLWGFWVSLVGRTQVATALCLKCYNRAPENYDERNGELHVDPIDFADFAGTMECDHCGEVSHA